MSKYIDAEKLIAEIKGIIAAVKVKKHPDALGSIEQCLAAAEIEALNLALDCIKELQQEQPKVDLEKFTETIKTFQERYKHPEIVSIKGAMAFMARMFYMHPNVAREWYDNLPKATMD